MNTTEIRYPAVTVQLTGEDGNAFNIIARVHRGILNGVDREAADAWVESAMACDSYDALLGLAQATVCVI